MFNNYALGSIYTVPENGVETSFASGLLDYNGIEHLFFDILPELKSDKYRGASIRPALMCPASIAGEAVMKVKQVFLYDNKSNAYKVDVPNRVNLYYTERTAARAGWVWHK